MGTSVSRRSPETPSWRAVRATYQTDLPIERVAREVWRAASTDPSAAWVDRLGSDCSRRDDAALLRWARLARRCRRTPRCRRATNARQSLHAESDHDSEPNRPRRVPPRYLWSPWADPGARRGSRRAGSTVSLRAGTRTEPADSVHRLRRRRRHRGAPLRSARDRDDG